MAVTLKGRVGSSLKADLRYWNPDRTELIDTTGSQARFQLRALGASQRVLLNARESATVGAILHTVAPGHWTLNLDASVTRSIPHRSRFELELVSDGDPDDVTFLFDGVINLNPEVITND